ncbi:MAG: bifunctional diaminohydroxyphosphoribosylaminopyrimidine deaminase/5-amino-6-(5-phosphoribosylamino)uracil reductase RibD, partial [Deltaproteobacteria bacterium]|nr:bifunctional diaminohydroxyphosphoribosylaminopyrimidine deaminase/5-amino-6-(5-phosphoribosylamino)uracil reductase RibD [Deltaproteobacteria bacterium]
MERAMELAKRGLGRTSPNPAVGAVIVKNNRVVGEGYHRKAGGPHAEIVALRHAGTKARGADLYVTLEPCCHWGKTPPCTDAIVAAGIRRVIVGCRDPFPLVKGKGIATLRRAHVRVTENVLRAACEEVVRPFSYRLRHGIPYVTLKAAVSLDGKIATSRGESRWITGPACRRYV